MQEPRDGRRAKTTILCRFPSDNSQFPETHEAKHLAVEIEYKDSQSSEGYSSRILLDCKVEEIKHILPHPHDVKRVTLSYGKIMHARSSSSSFILRGWKSEWFREKVYGRVPEFHYPDISVAEQTNHETWLELSFNVNPDFSKGIHISNGSNHIEITPEDNGIDLNGIHLSWFGVERLMTTLARHFFFRRQSGYNFTERIPPNKTTMFTITDSMAIFRHNLGFLEECKTPVGRGVALQAYNTYIAAKHEVFDWGNNLEISTADQDGADIHVKWEFDGELRYHFHNRTDRAAIIWVGFF